MSIRLQSAPASGRELVRDNLRLGMNAVAAAVPQAGVLAMAANAAPAAVFDEINASYPIYTASSERLADGTFLTSAELTAWQYVIGPDDGLQGLAEVAAVDGVRPSLSYAAYYEASSAQRLLEVIRRADAEAETGDYDLRILRAPDLFLVAVWLHAEDGNDVLLPVNAPSVLRGAERLRADELTAALQPLAQVRFNTSDR